MILALTASMPAATAEQTPATANPRSPSGGSASIAAQERARALAAELVRGVIDVQLRQLDENGLADRPIFGDIKALRGVVETLVRREMKDVIELLGRAEEATPAERVALVTDARNRARTIVTRLAAERQQILRRLKEATLAAQARAIVDRQKRLLTATESLSTLPDGRREQTMLAALEEERNVNTLVATLQAALDDVGNWGGDIGATGLAGLRTLEKEGVSEAVAAAERRLARADPVGAAAAQRRAIAGLEAVLATVEGNRAARPGNTDAGKEAAALGNKAADLRQEMAKVPRTDESFEKLLAEQAALEEALAALATDLQGEPVIARLAEQAREASLEAAANLLEGDQRQAVAAQDAVIERLAEVAAGLEEGRPAGAPASAAEFARRAAELMNVLEKVAAFARLQDEIARVAREQPQAVVEDQRLLAAGLAELVANESRPTDHRAGDHDTRPPLPLAVEQRIAAAADAAAELAQAPTPQAAEPALQAATDALEAATREIARAMADAERATLAAKAGELSRAAEVAERAAAVERGIAQGAKEAVKPAGAASRPRFDPLVTRQAEVADIAGKVGDAIDGLAPEAAETMAAARAAMQAAREQLEARAAAAERMTVAQQAFDQAAAEQAAQITDGQAMATNAAAPMAAEQTAAPQAQTPFAPQATAEAATQAAQLLAEAAAAMRADATQAAAEAAQVASTQPEAAAGGDPTAQPGLRKQQNELEAKANDLSRAAQLADRAAAAERGIAEEAEQFNASEKANVSQFGDAPPGESAAAAESLAMGLAAKQAELAIMAETVENAVEGLSPAAADKMAAARAAIEAAREQFETQAAEHGLASANPAGQQAAGNPSPNENRPGDQADAASRAPEMSAAKEPTAPNPAEAAPNPAEAAAAREAAAQNMAAAQAAADQAAQAAAAAAEQAAKSLVEAAAAMRDQATRAAEELAGLAARQSAEAAKAGSAAQETALARDQIVAEEIAAALREQGAAREAVAVNAAMFEQVPAGQEASLDREQAATTLADAKERFAAAQREIGERVAASLDQREIGNQRLRESLAAAAPQGDLGTSFLSESPETTADMIAGERANAAAEQALAAGDGRRQPHQGTADGLESGAEPAASQQAGPPQPGSQQAGSQQPESQQAASQSGDQQGDSQASGSQQASSQQQSSPHQPSEQTSTSGSRAGEARDDGPLREIAAVDRRSDPGSRDGDADAVEKSFERDAWFAKLPPEIRKAIRADSERRAPRGYEEKMKRYFKNID